MNCPICRSDKNSIFLERKNVPVHQNLVCDTREEALGVTRGDLILVMCECGFLFNESFDESLLSYGERYNNSQMASPIFQEYLDTLVDHLDLQNKTIVEIGCGQGDFLKKLCVRNRGIGFDPSYVGDEKWGRCRFVKSYYKPTPADVVVCRHVIEHTSRPMGLLNSIDAPKVFFETPNLNWILDNNTYWDFFYEHCSYFTKATLELSFQLAGYEGEAQESFGGQYLWFEGRYMGSGGEGCDIS